jgi:hypothetical protein
MSVSALLLVDDDRDTCASLSDIIADLGYRVDVADDGPPPWNGPTGTATGWPHPITRCPAWTAWSFTATSKEGGPTPWVSW